MAALTDFQFFFCPAMYCHADHLHALPYYSHLAALPDKYRYPALNTLLFEHYSLSENMAEPDDLQRVILFDDTELQRFMTMLGCCFYLNDLMICWPDPARRQPFSVLTPADAALLLRWRPGLLRPLQEYQHSLADTKQDDLILSTTGYRLWLFLIQDCHEQFRRRAELRFPQMPLPVSFPAELISFFKLLCQTISQVLTPSVCPSAG